MKKIAITLILLFCFGYTAAATVEVTLHGPKTYVRTTGSPDVLEDAFPGVVGEATIIVTNGGQDGENAVSSAVITVNGNVVFRAKDFNQNVSELTATLNLQEDNTLRVDLRSIPESYLTIEVRQTLDVDAAAVIGPEGGVVATSSGHSVKIDEGSLESYYLISIDPLEEHELSADMPDDYDYFFGAVRLEPSGIIFQKIVMVTFKLVEYLEPNSMIPVSIYDETLSAFKDSGYIAIVGQDGYSATADVGHFSEDALFAPEAGDVTIKGRLTFSNVEGDGEGVIPLEDVEVSLIRYRFFNLSAAVLGTDTTGDRNFDGIFEIEPSKIAGTFEFQNVSGTKLNSANKLVLRIKGKDSQKNRIVTNWLDVVPIEDFVDYYFHKIELPLDSLANGNQIDLGDINIGEERPAKIFNALRRTSEANRAILNLMMIENTIGFNQTFIDRVTVLSHIPHIWHT